MLAQLTRRRQSLVTYALLKGLNLTKMPDSVERRTCYQGNSLYLLLPGMSILRLGRFLHAAIMASEHVALFSTKFLTFKLWDGMVRCSSEQQEISWDLIASPQVSISGANLMRRPQPFTLFFFFFLSPSLAFSVSFPSPTSPLHCHALQ